MLSSDLTQVFRPVVKIFGIDIYGYVKTFPPVFTRADEVIKFYKKSGECPKRSKVTKIKIHIKSQHIADSQTIRCWQVFDSQVLTVWYHVSI